MIIDRNTVDTAQVRQQLKELLDKANSRDERFVVVPMRQYDEMQALKAQARSRFMAKTKAIREVFSPLSRKERSNLIEDAVNHAGSSPR